GWEDSAVPPARLGDYLRDLNKLYDEFGYSDESGPGLYGHFGQGCVHTRIPFDLYSAEGVHKYRRFMKRAADLVVRYGGSLSGGSSKRRPAPNNRGTVMCPASPGTLEEDHWTRGRARLLVERANRHGATPVTGGWRSEEVKDALDL